MEPSKRSGVSGLVVLLGIIVSWVPVGFGLSLLPISLRVIPLALEAGYILASYFLFFPWISKRLRNRWTAGTDAKTR